MMETELDSVDREQLAVMQKHGRRALMRACDAALAGDWGEWKKLFGREPKSLRDAHLGLAIIEHYPERFLAARGRGAEHSLDTLCRIKSAPALIAQAEVLRRAETRHFDQLCAAFRIK